jgi:hypothetical protein
MREDSEFINAMMAKQGARLIPVSVGKEVDVDPLSSS